MAINLPYAHVWNTVVMSGIVPLVATWNCLTSYKNEYAVLFVLHLLFLLNPFLNIKLWPVFSVGMALVDVLENWLNCFHLLFLVGGLLVILIDCMIFVTIP